MRMAYVACCVIFGGLVGATMATADRQVETNAAVEAVAVNPSVATGGVAILCPLWPLEDLGGGDYLFYAEWYDNYECLHPADALFIGNAPDWPYLCPDCLTSSSLVAPETSRDNGERRVFGGLDRKLPADYRPTFPPQLYANDGVSFVGEEFVDFTVPGTQTARRIKLFRVQLERAAAGKGVSRMIGLGYEVASESNSAPTLNVTDSTVTPVRGSSHAYTLRVDSQDYMVLLAK